MPGLACGSEKDSVSSESIAAVTSHSGLRNTPSPLLRTVRVDRIRASGPRASLTFFRATATGNDWLPAADTAFDVILLDAPCSGSGTLRRHPDIKLLRQPEDLTAYARQQGRLLDNLWQHLTPGGTLLYCTCSLFAEENDQVIAAFLAEHDEASIIEPLTLPLGMATRHGWQLLPLPAGGSVPNRTVDGFYFARMTRREKAS